MKCNQEQWDSIKEKLVHYSEKCCNDFKTFNYLVNNSGGVLNTINNIDSYWKASYNRQSYETWNEQVFLEACGIETEKIFKAGELEFINHSGEWQETTGEYRLRIKPDNTAKIAELEIQIEILKNK